jgi:hypothetical protein
MRFYKSAYRTGKRRGSKIREDKFCQLVGGSAAVLFQFPKHPPVLRMDRRPGGKRRRPQAPIGSRKAAEVGQLVIRAVGDRFDAEKAQIFTWSSVTRRCGLNWLSDSSVTEASVAKLSPVRASITSPTATASGG